MEKCCQLNADCWTKANQDSELSQYTTEIASSTPL
jgi:hypothetical protein